MPRDPIDQRRKARQAKPSKPTTNSRRKRRLAELQRRAPAPPPEPTGPELGIDLLAVQLYRHLVSRGALAGDATDSLDTMAAKVADWLREHPRDARVLARHHLGRGAGADLVLPELPQLPDGPDLGGLADLQVVLEHQAARRMGEPALVAPPAPDGWAVREPVICTACLVRKWLITPTAATRAQALEAGAVATIATRWVDDAGAPHTCEL